jgi:hypothetical protein
MIDVYLSGFCDKSGMGDSVFLADPSCWPGCKDLAAWEGTPREKVSPQTALHSANGLAARGERIGGQGEKYFSADSEAW